MTVKVDWAKFVRDMLPGFELAAMEGEEGVLDSDKLRVEIVRVDPSAPIPEDRECHIFSECVRQVLSFAALVNATDWEGDQPGLYVALTFIDP